MMKLQACKFFFLTLLLSYQGVLGEYEDICGIENKPDFSFKIIGGKEASPNQFPWLVFVKIILPQGIASCTGSVINENWVLTAAHCVKGAISHIVYAGTHNYNFPESKTRQRIKSEYSVPHPNYVSSSDDIALIKLSKPLKFNKFVRPTCLPTLSDAENLFSSKHVTITGWGRSRGEPIPEIKPYLQYAKGLRVIKNKECKKYYGLAINKKMICIDASYGRGVCNGDSGGPLNYKMKNGQYKQIGVADFVGSRRCIDGKPHAFARVTEYLSWISKTTGRKISE